MNNKHRNDILLILALLLVSAAVWGAVALTRKPGDLVIVEINGEQYASFPINEDTRIEIPTEGGHVNVLVIEGGKAYIESADCPDKLCVKSRAISGAGESIICLPHKLVVRISGESGVDAVT